MRTKICILFLIVALFAGAGLIATAQEAPGVRVLGSLANVYEPVTFDHRMHTAAATGCAVCHHEHARGDGLPCKECHAVTPALFKNSVTRTFMACRDCHASLDRDNPGMPGLKVAYHRKCFGCHRGMGEIGRDPKGCTEICHAKRSGTANDKSAKSAD